MYEVAYLLRLSATGQYIWIHEEYEWWEHAWGLVAELKARFGIAEIQVNGETVYTR